MLRSMTNVILEGVSMSIVVRFQASNLKRSQYDTVRKALQESGNWPVPGCLFHVCFGDEGDLHVSEIWELPEQLGGVCRDDRATP